ncbi:Hypothetical protein BN2458_PEG1251 [Helicobacter typhlonius]|uniref:Uncharacterized protein n=1 Tax=Helicobacter typhlonius TaxID=76936 RepID=A0A0S4PUZ5_9HELI|nr:Hypothetical protein BN2458_PEG1251 [Helicobacter typhlonius]
MHLRIWAFRFYCNTESALTMLERKFITRSDYGIPYPDKL